MLLLYKLAALAVVCVFAFFVFDIRNKPGMVPIVNPLWTRLMKTLSFAVMGVYLTVLAQLAAVDSLDLVALGLTAAGAALVATAKVTLGRFHTWTGFHLEKTTIVQNGIYARLRHPLYTGIFLFEAGGLLLLLPRIPPRPWFLLPAVLLTVAYLMTFNILMARRESREMARKFGPDFAAYKARVRAFLPIPTFGGRGSQAAGGDA